LRGAPGEKGDSAILKKELQTDENAWLVTGGKTPNNETWGGGGGWGPEFFPKGTSREGGEKGTGKKIGMGERKWGSVERTEE